LEGGKVAATRRKGSGFCGEMNWSGSPTFLPPLFPCRRLGGFSAFPISIGAAVRKVAA
jgi:hypothetical protein